MLKRIFPVLVMVVLIIAVSSQAAWAQENLLPAPTGTYQVGRVTRHWVDEARDEPLSEDPNDHRELIVRIWYPAEVDTGATPALYMEDLTGPMGDVALESWLLGWPEIEASDPGIQALIQWRTHTVPDVPVSNVQAIYPVLIFSPGYHSIPEQSSILIEELASHGYVVVGVNHPYISSPTVFPDGRVVTGIDVNFQNREKRGSVENTGAQDILFVLDQLETLNDDDPEAVFTGRLDLERIAVFGHSLGGWVAALAGTIDNRIRAIVNEDGRLIPIDYDATKLAQPFMFFTPIGPGFPSAGPSYRVVVVRFGHVSFLDVPMWPLPITLPITDIGSIDGSRTVDIVRAYVLAFFDQYLKGEEQPLLQGSSADYPEVEIQARNT